MHTLEFNTRSHEFKSLSKGERSFFRSALGMDAPLSEVERQPVDRTRFFTDDAELETAIRALEIMLVGPNEAADNRGVVKAPRSLLRAGLILLDEDIRTIAEARDDIGPRLENLVDKAQSNRTRQANSEDWWGRFSDANHFSHNVFKTDPTEQIIIGRDQIEPVTIYNFGEKLRSRDIAGMIGGIAAMSALTDGYARALSPYVVVHEAFLDQHFEQDDMVAKAAGRAWLGEPFIEVRGSSLRKGAAGSMGQPWSARVVGHEWSHQIDEAVSKSYPDFSNYFHYVDSDGDGLIDYVKPIDSFASDYEPHEIYDSRPLRQYGYTNGAEDFATVGEEVPFGGHVDTLRRDAYMEIIEAFKQKGHEKYGDMQPMPEKLKVEIARGGEIQLPVAPALAEPIRVRVENKYPNLKDGLLQWFARVTQ